MSSSVITEITNTDTTLNVEASVMQKRQPEQRTKPIFCVRCNHLGTQQTIVFLLELAQKSIHSATRVGCPGCAGTIVGTGDTSGDKHHDQR